jgi:hypothetical protein
LNTANGISDADIIANYGNIGYANNEHLSLSQLFTQIELASGTSEMEKMNCRGAFEAVQTRIAQRACSACIGESNRFISAIKSADRESFASIFGINNGYHAFLGQLSDKYAALLACVRRCQSQEGIANKERNECTNAFNKILIESFEKLYFGQ